MTATTEALKMTKASTRRLRVLFGNEVDGIFTPVDMTGGVASIFDLSPALAGKVTVVSTDLPAGEVGVEVALDGSEPLSLLIGFRVKVVLSLGAGIKTTPAIQLVVV